MVNLRSANVTSGDVVQLAPGYSNSFVKVQNGLTKHNITNKTLLTELNQYGRGWKKYIKMDILMEK